MNRTCRISPLANAPTSVFGMMDRAKPTAVKWLAAEVIEMTLLPSVRLVACRPTPGWKTFTAMKPSSMPTVDITSKYTSALADKRPNCLMSFTCVSPSTTEQKMIGASSMRSSAMNASPNGFVAIAASGAQIPTTMARTSAISTCT